MKGDAVEVIDGPFSGFNGIVDEVNPEKEKVRVIVSIFGRQTPIELDYLQIKRVG
jgi:transcriptional antiterminator NusG